MTKIVKRILGTLLIGFATVHGGWEPATAGWWSLHPGSSWLLGGSIGPFAVAVWLAAALLFLAAGCSLLGWIIPADWWRSLAPVAALLSLLLALLYVHPWQWAAGIIDMTIICALLVPASPLAQLDQL